MTVEVIGNNKLIVSVLILTYNQEDSILKTLESVSNQETDFMYEVIIGEDGSADRTRQICEEFISQSESNVYLYPQSPNVGLVENFKRLVIAAKGKYIACCAGDDYWCDTKKIQKQVNFLERNPEYGLVHTNFKVYLPKTNQFVGNNLKHYEGNVFDNLLEFNFIAALTVLSRKKHVIEAIEEGILSRGFLMEDYPVWLYIAQKSKIGYLDDETAVWNMTEHSVSRTTSVSKGFTFMESTVDVVEYFVERYHCSPTIRASIIAKYRGLLLLAFKHQLKEKGRVVYLKLKQLTKVTFKDYLLYVSTQNSIVSFPLKWIRKGIVFVGLGDFLYSMFPFLAELNFKQKK